MKKISWMGLKLFLVVVAVYIVLFAVDGAKAVEALGKTGLMLLEIAPILLVVLFLMALINYKFNPKKLAEHLGEESGMKGWLLALGLGILSHGPMYAWYPMLKDLMKHGLKYSLITAFFYARAVKVPIMPLMVSYFGLAFTIVLTLYIIVAAFIQGLLIERLCGKTNRCD